MTADDIKRCRDKVLEAYLASLEGKSVSFTGANGRTLVNHDPDKIWAQYLLWARRYQVATGQGTPYKLARF